MKGRRPGIKKTSFPVFSTIRSCFGHLLCCLDPVAFMSGASWYETTHNDILLEAAQIIDPAGHSRIGQDLCGLLERRRRDEAVGA